MLFRSVSDGSIIYYEMYLIMAKSKSTEVSTRYKVFLGVSTKFSSVSVTPPNLRANLKVVAC